MKFLKIFSVLALSALTINMSAETNVMAQLVFSSVEATTNYLISQDDAVDNNFTSESCGKITLSPDAYALYAYTEYNSEKYAAVDLKNISNIVVKFEPNAYETAYTLSVSDVEGDFMMVCGNDTITDSKNNPYNFTATSIVEFTVNPGVVYPYTRDIATGKWGTICFPEAISEVVGANIYEFVGKTETSVMADPVSLPLEKGKAYLFLASADAQGFNYSSASVATAPVANNGLVGTFEDMTSTDEAPYVIKGNSLVPASKANVPANRAYVPNINAIVSPSAAPARAGRMIFNIVGTATGVEELEAAPAMNGKVMMNGKLVIIRDGKMFNAQGAAL